MMELPDYNFYEFKEPLDAHFALEEWEDSYKQNSSRPWEPSNSATSTGKRIGRLFFMVHKVAICCYY